MNVFAVSKYNDHMTMGTCTTAKLDRLQLFGHEILYELTVKS